VVGDARDLAVQALAYRIALFDTLPRVGLQLLIAQRDSLAVFIKLQDLDLNRIAHLEKLGRVLKTPPRHVCYMKESINAAKIDERAVVSQILNLPFDDDVLFDLVQRLVFDTFIALFDDGFA